MAPITLGYWNVRGLGTPIRLLLELAGADYVEKLYKCGGPPDFDRSHWLNEKFTLGLDFPNLPYLIDGDIKITQSHVIMRYLARKFNLAGKDEKGQLRADLVATQAMDYHMDYVRIVYNPQFLSLKEDYKKTVPDKMQRLADFLGAHKFVAGDEVTYADFVLFEYLEGQLYFDDQCLSKFPALQSYRERILDLPAVKNYFSKPTAIKFPFNGAPALIGGAYSDQLLKKQ